MHAGISCQLHRQRSHSTRRAQDQQRLSRLDLRELQHLCRGLTDKCDTGCFFGRDGRGSVSKSGSVDHHELGVCTTLSRGAKDLIAHFEGCDALAHGSHSAGDIATGRPWKLQWEDVAQETETAPWIHPIQAGEVILD
jgi:hypothetical protein